MHDENPLARRYNFLEIMKFTMPNMIMMVFMSLYTIADGMFISRYAGEVALGSTNIYYPVMSVQLGLGIMIGTGGSAVIALKLGQGRNREAREDFTVLTALSALIGIVIGAVCIIFTDPILRALGSSDLQMPHARMYAIGTLLFSPMFFLQLAFQTFFVAAGKPKLGLVLTVIGGVLNMILDWLFMGPLGWGVIGAAVATGIGWSVTGIYGLLYFAFSRKSNLWFVKMKIRPQVIIKTCTNGSSEMVSNCAIAVTTFLFNIIFMRFWQETGITAITILMYYQYVFVALFLGFSMGVAPVISFKYGAGDTEQLRLVTRESLLFSAGASLVVFIISHLTVRMSLLFFVDPGSAVYDLAMEGFRIFALQFLFTGISIMASGMFTALNNGLVSGIISFSRTFFFLVVTLLVFPEIWGETGVWMAVPVAELLGVIVAASFIVWGRKKYNY